MPQPQPIEWANAACLIERMRKAFVAGDQSQRDAYWRGTGDTFAEFVEREYPDIAHMLMDSDREHSI